MRMLQDRLLSCLMTAFLPQTVLIASPCMVKLIARCIFVPYCTYQQLSYPDKLFRSVLASLAYSLFLLDMEFFISIFNRNFLHILSGV